MKAEVNCHKGSSHEQTTERPVSDSQTSPCIYFIRTIFIAKWRDVVFPLMSFSARYKNPSKMLDSCKFKKKQTRRRLMNGVKFLFVTSHGEACDSSFFTTCEELQMEQGMFFCEAHCTKGVRDSVRAEYKNHRACIQSRTKSFTVMFRRSLFRFYKYPLKSLNY